MSLVACWERAGSIPSFPPKYSRFRGNNEGSRSSPRHRLMRLALLALGSLLNGLAVALTAPAEPAHQIDKVTAYSLQLHSSGRAQFPTGTDATTGVAAVSASTATTSTTG